jgi:hypothetical protein
VRTGVGGRVENIHSESSQLFAHVALNPSLVRDNALLWATCWL